MNNSWHTGRGRNPNQPRTSDFMGFSNEPQSPSGNPFNPLNFSSPQRSLGHRPFNQQNRRWDQNKTFHGYSNTNNSSSPNRSFNFNSSYNNHNRGRNQNRGFNHSFNYKAKQDHNNTFNKHVFLHPSFMEDPWAQLEARQRQNEATTTQVEAETKETSAIED